MTYVLTLTPSAFPDLYLACLAHGDAVALGTLTREEILVIARIGSDFPRRSAVPNAPDADHLAMEEEQDTAARLALNLLEAPGMDRVRQALISRPRRLLVHSQLPELAAVPWEILSESADLRLHGVEIERMLPGVRSGITPSTALEVLMWCPTPDDAACTPVLRALLQYCPADMITKVYAGQPIPDPDWRARVLFVVTHGTASPTGFLFGGTSSGHDSRSIRQWLSPTLPSTRLVVLNVCGAGRLDDRGASAAQILVGGGAPALVASACPLPADAAVALDLAILRAITRGASIREAVAAGRRAMVGLANGHPGRRWWNPTLTVSGMDVTTRSVFTPLNPGYGIQVPGPLLGSALRSFLARATPGSMRGVEDLARCLLYSGTVPERQLSAMHRIANPPWSVEEGMTAAEDRAPFTLRLGAVLRSLPAGFELPELFDAVLSAHPLGRRRPAAAITDGSKEELGTRAVGPLETSGSVTLEVLGGPEDGRVIVLDQERPWLGRWVRAATQPGERLFEAIGPADLSVSREHLRLVGQRSLLARASVEVILPTMPTRWATARSFPASAGQVFDLEPGMVVIVGSTWLEVRSVGTEVHRGSAS